MNIRITEVTADRRSVSVDGVLVGEIACVHLDERQCRNDYAAGCRRGGSRWLPSGVDPLIDGPHSAADAALLFLALYGYDELEAIKALYPNGRIGCKKRAAA